MVLRKKVLIVVGARPNYMKAAPLTKEFKKYQKRFSVKLVHTEQHYDFRMSEIFFRDLGLPKPDMFLNAGSASHAVQTAKIMRSFERVCLKEKPDLVIVVGDVNSTLACSIVAAKLQIKVAHVEAGLRSFDRTMPEEINRIVTDTLSDFLFVSEPSGIKNLKKEGACPKKVFFVGNTMIDTLLANVAKIDRNPILSALKLKRRAYAVLTLHRPSNVDSKDSLEKIFRILKMACGRIKIIYPAHPRARKMIRTLGLEGRFNSLKGLKIIEPLGYLDFVKLVKESAFVLTDSGGIQEETTVLGVPCLTMRKNTERPVTTTEGTNVVVGTDEKLIKKNIADILNGRKKRGRIPKFWDGKTAKRIVSILSSRLA